MHEHDGKLDRARTERIELMEVCPVCGEQRRNSARFCTTCGHRFATNEIADTPAPPAPVSANPLSPASGDDAGPMISGWPAPSAEPAASPWAPQADNRGSWPAPPEEPTPGDAQSEVTWADVAASAFVSASQPQTADNQPQGLSPDDDFEVTEDSDLEEVQADSRDVELRQRARALVSELQEVLESLTGGSAAANSNLVAELEISLTRPAALEGDALADLSAAAEAAQERPRDLDTITALTAQAETILAVIVGYERATAGIERALASLRGNDADPAG